MSISHQFVLKDYKDSWNSGPPWAKCHHCDQEDRLDDVTTIFLSKRHDSKAFSSVQNTDLLSPRAAVFHPSGHLPHNDSRGHRPFRSLPSRYRGGNIAGRDLTRFTPHRGALHRRPTAYYPFPIGVAEPANSTPAFRFNPEAQYQDCRAQDSRLKGSNQIWGSMPIKSPVGRMRIPEKNAHHNKIIDTSHQDMNIDNQQPLGELRLHGVSTLSAATTEFISRNQ
jgi:hypothetical protein